MLKELGDIAPMPVFVSIGGWCALSYFFLGPEIGERVAMADHTPQCIAQTKQNEQSALIKQVMELDNRPNDDMKIAATRQQLNILTDPSNNAGKLMGLLGYDQQMKGLMALAEAKQQKAKQALEQAKQHLREQSKARIAAAPDYCACLTVAAVEESKSDWAFFAGSFGLIERGKVSGFKGVLQEMQTRGMCDGKKIS